MSKCENCGSEMPVDSSTCPNCGQHPKAIGWNVLGPSATAVAGALFGGCGLVFAIDQMNLPRNRQYGFEQIGFACFAIGLIVGALAVWRMRTKGSRK